MLVIHYSCVQIDCFIEVYFLVVPLKACVRSDSRADGQTDLAEESVLVVPDGNVFVLRCVGDDFDEPSDLGLSVQRHAEQLCNSKTLL